MKSGGLIVIQDYDPINIYTKVLCVLERIAGEKTRLVSPEDLRKNLREQLFKVIYIVPPA
jgi:hypothetical protein